MKTIKKWQDVPRSEAGWANWPALMQREIDELRQALAQPESEPTSGAWFEDLKFVQRVLESHATEHDRLEALAAVRRARKEIHNRLIELPESEPSDREALIAGIKAELANFAHNKTLETLLLDSVDMLEADAQEITALHLEIDELHSRMKAQQVAVPPTWDDKSEVMLHLNTLESMLGGANGPTIRLRVLLQAVLQPATYVPLTDDEIKDIYDGPHGLDFYLNFAKAIEQAVRGKT